MVVIIDYGMGNLASVAKACRFLGAEAKVTSSPSDVRRARALILPGVGAFGAAMRELKSRRLVGPILEGIEKGKPFLGLCLGLQLLLEASDESPGVRGLGVFPGRVKRLPRKGGLKVPHMGWNQVDRARSSELGAWRNGLLRVPSSEFRVRCALLRGIPDGAFFYFVHSYYADPEDSGRIAATTQYGRGFPSVLWNGGRLWATQFHPEKSQRWGLKLLENFLFMVQRANGLTFPCSSFRRLI